MAVTVDDAEKAMIAEAEAHEREHGSEFCPHIRSALVGHLMYNMGLEMEDLGLVATAYLEAHNALENTEPPDQWDDVVTEHDHE